MHLTENKLDAYNTGIVLNTAAVQNIWLAGSVSREGLPCRREDLIEFDPWNPGKEDCEETCSKCRCWGSEPWSSLGSQAGFIGDPWVPKVLNI